MILNLHFLSTDDYEPFDFDVEEVSFLLALSYDQFNIEIDFQHEFADPFRLNLSPYSFLFKNTIPRSETLVHRKIQIYINSSHLIKVLV